MDATVTSLVTSLSNGQADLTQAQNFYNDIVGSLSRIPFLVNSASVAHSSGVVALPATAVALIFAFYGGVQLGELSKKEASWLFPDWPETTGTSTFNFIREHFNQRSFQLVQIPNAAGNATLVYSEVRQTLPTILQLPIALLVLEREYRRESPHKNPDMSQACGSLGLFLLKIAIGQNEI